MIKTCSECQALLTEKEKELYGDKCEKHAKEHAKSFPQRLEELGKDEE